MRPQLQKYLFNDGSGQYGDCHRTCIAMIFDLDRDDVPHFMEDVPPGQSAECPESVAAEAAERQWVLDRFGVTPVSIGYTGDTPLDGLLTTLGHCLKGAAAILGCRSGNGNHSVVVYQGEIYNPHGEGVITGPMTDGFWWVTIYSHATKPLHTAPAPASVVTQEEH